MANNKTKPHPEKENKKRAKEPKEDHNKEDQSEGNDFGGIPGGKLKKNLGCGG